MKATATAPRTHGLRDRCASLSIRANDEVEQMFLSRLYVAMFVNPKQAEKLEKFVNELAEETGK